VLDIVDTSNVLTYTGMDLSGSSRGRVVPVRQLNTATSAYCSGKLSTLHDKGAPTMSSNLKAVKKLLLVATIAIALGIASTTAYASCL
jgi:hypothetical protein